MLLLIFTIHSFITRCPLCLSIPVHWLTAYVNRMNLVKGNKFLLRSWDMVWISTHLPGSKGGSGLECPGGSWGLGSRYQVGLASRGLGSLGSLTSFSAPPWATLRSQRTLYIHAWSGSPLHTSVPAGGCLLTLSLGFGRQRWWPFKCSEGFQPLVYAHGTPRWTGAGQLLCLLSCLSLPCIDPPRTDTSGSARLLLSSLLLAAWHLYLYPSLFFLSPLMIFVVNEISTPVL